MQDSNLPIGTAIMNDASMIRGEGCRDSRILKRRVACKRVEEKNKRIIVNFGKYSARAEGDMELRERFFPPSLSLSLS